MTKRPIVSRRALLAGLSWLVTPGAWAQTRRGNDHGIGGTGVSSATSGDHGIGGTGIVGVIQRFGSIYVNGERISYPADVPVRIDDQPATAKALRIGQLARTLATREANGSLTTRAINVVSEVAGPIDAVGKGEITVLGQRVLWNGRANWLRPGAEVAVFGLRQTNGTIVASLVDQRPGTTAHVTGVLERDATGLHIGALRLDGMTTALVDRRVRIEGRAAQGVMQVSRASVDDLSDLAGARHLLIETYARRDGENLRLGSGYVARNALHYRPTTSGEARVVISAVRDGAQGLQIEAVRSPHGTSTPSGTAPGGGPGATPNAPGQAPGGARGPGGSSGPGGASGPGSSGPGPSGAGPSGPGGASGPSGLGGPGGPFGPGGTFGPGGPGGMGGGGFGGGGMGGGGGRR